jgi:hypothetical protein
MFRAQSAARGCADFSSCRDQNLVASSGSAIRRMMLGHRGRLLLLVVAALAPLAAFQVYELAKLHKRQLSDAHERVMELAHRVAARHDDAVADVRRVLEVMSRVPEAAVDDSARCGEVLAAIAQPRPWLSALRVVGSDHRVQCGTVPKDNGASVVERGWYQDVITLRQFIVGAFEIAPARQVPSAVAAAPGLPGTVGEDRVFVATFDLAWLDKIGEEFGRQSNAHVMLLDRHGRLLLQYPSAATAIGSDVSGHAFAGPMLGQPHGSLEAAGLDGTVRILGYRRLADSGAVLAVSFERSAVLAHVVAATLGSVGVFALVSLLAGLLIWAGGQRLFADPLRKNAALLKATLENIDQGVIVVDANGRLPVCNRRAMQLLDLPESLMASQPHADDVIAFQTARGDFRDLSEDVRARLLPKVFGDRNHTYERRCDCSVQLSRRASCHQFHHSAAKGHRSAVAAAQARAADDQRVRTRS